MNNVYNACMKGEHVLPIYFDVDMNDSVQQSDDSDYIVIEETLDDCVVISVSPLPSDLAVKVGSMQLGQSTASFSRFGVISHDMIYPHTMLRYNGDMIGVIIIFEKPNTFSIHAVIPLKINLL